MFRLHSHVVQIELKGGCVHVSPAGQHMTARSSEQRLSRPSDLLGSPFLFLVSALDDSAQG